MPKNSISDWKRVLADPETRKAYAESVREHDAAVGAFLEFDPERRLHPPITATGASGAQEAEAGAARGDRDFDAAVIDGMPFGVKDNIAVAGFKLTCGSRMLEDLVSPYTATAVRRLEAAGARVVGKTNLDEFGMGSSTDNSALGVTNNPHNHARVAGGSSGGSAAAVAADLVPFALGSDTGGSIRQPASFCGVYGLKPTYGTVSRYGLVAFASSLDVVSVLARELSVLKAAFAAMRGPDERDHSSIAPADIPAGELPTAEVRTIGVLRGLGRAEAGGGGAGGRPSGASDSGGSGGLDPAVAAAYERTVERLIAAGYEVKELELDTLKYVVPAYYTIATAEASANLARYNGVRYGLRPEMAENPEELVRSAREEGFGPEVKLRILLGTYVLRSGFQDQYYLRAQKIRTAIRNELSEVFGGVQALLTPTAPVLPFAHGESELSAFQQKLADRFTATANLAGIPAISVPGEQAEGLPIGMQLLAPAFGEARLFAVAERLAALDGRAENGAKNRE